MRALRKIALSDRFRSDAHNADKRTHADAGRLQVCVEETIGEESVFFSSENIGERASLATLDAIPSSLNLRS